VGSIERTPRINPAESPEMSPQRVRRLTVVIHDFGGGRGVRVDPPAPAHLDRQADRVTVRLDPERSSATRHHRRDASWLGLAERVLHSWPITLRLAVLVVVLATGTAAVAAVVGVAGQLFLAGLGLRAHHRRGRHLADRRGSAALPGDERPLVLTERDES
jgi:hypothetical protein